MILPLEKLIADKSNRYELCSACMHRANQLSIAPDDEVDDNGNVVSTSIKQILTKKVRYEIGNKNL